MLVISAGFDGGGGKTGSALLVESGPTLVVNIGFDKDYTPGGPPPIASHVHELAIIDTGATECGVDEALAQAAHLPLIDRVTVGAATGPAILNVYLAQVYLNGLGLAFVGRFGGMQLVATGAKQTVLLGRDVLRHLEMRYNGRSGAVSLSLAE